MEFNENGILAIGGMPGSGTRVVAKILMESGFHFGNDINPQNDNLFFSRPFNFPEQLSKEAHPTREKLLGIFEKWMKGYALSGSELDFYLENLFKNPLIAKAGFKANKVRLANAKRKILSPKKQEGFAWKEPVNQLFLEPLFNYWPELKYVQVVRDGLDMAFSKMKAVVPFWGEYLGIKDHKSAENLPSKMLDFWLLTNQKVLDLAADKYNGRIFFLRLEELCDHPETVIQSLIIQFLEIDVQKVDLSPLSQIPKSPSSRGRHKKMDLSLFGEAQMEAFAETNARIDAIIRQQF